LQTLLEVGPVVENPKDYALASNFMWVVPWFERF
jgi:hypothetical protein